MICGSCRTWALVAGAFLTVSVLGAAPGSAQTWPQRPVKLILTLGPGSGTDIGMRLLADRLPKVWNQPVVVENRPGGDGIVAITSFLSSNDDHVLLGAPVSSFTAHPYVVPNLPYRQNDLAPIARGWNLTLVVAVPKAMPVNSMKELVELTRKQPGKLNWAGTTGAIDFLFAGWLKKNNLEMARVPYRNPQDASNDLATERIQVVDASLPTMRPQLQAGTIKLLAVTNAERDPALPDVPTVKEAGYPELTLDGLIGVFGSSAMPAALRDQIAAAVKAAVSDPLVGERLALTGQTLNFGGPAAFAADINAQSMSVAAAAKALGIKPLQ
jgi:tripartite-type tricarboxylate transporter receptor subunit TctC